MSDSYVEVVSLVASLRWHLLEIIKRELDRLDINDINNSQGLMLFNIGDAEVTVGELTLRGCRGSNISYNLTMMVENGYLVRQRSMRDRRVIHVKLTDKGHDLWHRLDDMHRQHVEMLSTTMVTGDELENIIVPLRQLEQFWISAGDRLATSNRQRRRGAAGRHKRPTFGSRNGHLPARPAH
jgi:DNA-binding MarR family transcriptional regulator